MDEDEKNMLPGEFALPAELDLRAAVALHGALSAALDQSNDLVLDASQVVKLSTPCVQIIISAMNSMERESRICRMTEPSAYFSNFMNDLGFGEMLERWRLADG